VALRKLGRLDEAVSAYDEAVRARADFSLAYNNLANAYLAQGRGDEAIACYRKAVASNPAGAMEHSNLLYALHFHSDCDPTSIFEEHLAWARRHAEPLTALAPAHAIDRAPQRRLRIGYISPHFCRHAVSFFMEPIVASHDREQFEIFCYNDLRIDPDATTARFKAAAEHWRDVGAKSDDEIARMVRDDRIDILVDLTGHVGGNRLLVLARKPAPIQVTYLGYQNTTGMTAIDYRLTDLIADPPGEADRLHTEQLIRLPGSFFCYRPPDEAPPVTPLPALASGVVTFGSFNNFAKVTSSVIEAWMEILAGTPKSRLLVLAYRSGYVERRLRQAARERGLDPARVELFDRQPLVDYLRLLGRADIALDPFPFNGHTTTCDSIWMGVPVVMLEGNSYASRFGTSVLANLALQNWIAKSREEYIALAIEMASDIDRLATLRDRLRPRMAASALLDFHGFTRKLEQAYREMWLKRCSAS
jgi:predicted O-linked N-acetylglucosamine transferase (SPINDLY family)